MRINDALKVIEEYAPLSYQEEYDNSGLRATGTQN